MQTHSSSVVATKAARALEEVLDRDYASVEEFVRDLERNSSVLRGANPSHATLQNSQREIVAAVDDLDTGTVEEAKERARMAIDAVVERIETGKDRAAENAATLLEDGMTILTHDYSTTVMGAIERAVADGIHLDVYVTEARPRVLGRKTARELADVEGVDVTLVTDGACGIYLPECDEVFVGMDCIVDDALYNRVGTYPIAATAADVGVPVTVVGSAAKIVDEGFRFENDYRAASEVIREPPTGFAVENPVYDATPTRLIDRVVTDEGVTEF